jgi:surfactin synthase thioesterase subunit
MKDPWVEIFHPNSQANFRLFCFPYAGGAASLFRLWSKGLPASVEVCPIQLPGRGRRFGETPQKQWHPLVPDLTDAVAGFADRPFGFYGHSLGAVLAFEVARDLRRRYDFTPRIFFAAACRAPQTRVLPSQPLHTLADGPFLESLKNLGGMNEEILRDKDLMKLFLPVLRADLQLVETYRYAGEEPLACPLVALGGEQDREIKISELRAWSEQSVGEFDFQILPGDHFFLNSQREALLQVISQKILQFLT